MKKTILILSITFTVLLVQSCRGTIEQDITQYNNVSDIITQGEWKINQYINNNLDETNVFTGYTFQFNSNGTLLAKNNVGEVSGRWFEDKIMKQVTIQFVSNNDLEKINDSWIVNNKQLSSVNLTVSNTPSKLLIIAKN